MSCVLVRTCFASRQDARDGRHEELSVGQVILTSFCETLVVFTSYRMYPV